MKAPVYRFTPGQLERGRLILKQLRIERGYSLSDVGQRLNLTKVSIQKIENSNLHFPTYEKLFALLDLYKINPKYFEELINKGNFRKGKYVVCR